MSASLQFCTFRVCDLFLGLDVLNVQEVLRARELARVPLAPPNIEGLLNLRGQIVTAIDLRQRLGFPPRAAEEAPMFMIVRTNEGAVALLVDSVGDVIEAEPTTFEAAPDTLAPHLRGLITGVHKLQPQLLHVLDISAATSVAETLSH